MKYKIIILLTLLILLSGCIEVNVNWKDKEDQIEEVNKTEKVEIIEEEFCNLKIGDYCCLYSEKQYGHRIWGLCEDKEEIEAYKEEKEKALNRYTTTGKVEVNLKHNILYVEPTNWYVMRNYKMAGMDVFISYFRSIDKKRPSVTEVEIRVVYYENKEDLTIEEFKEKLVPLLTNGQIKKTMPKSYKIPFERKGYNDIFKSSHTIEGIWFEVYAYGDYEENYYYVEILKPENKTGFYAIIFKDPMERGVGSYDNDPAWKAINEFSWDFRFTDYTDEKFEILLKGYTSWGVSLSFEKPTEVRYKIKSEGVIDFQFLKSWDDWYRYLKAVRGDKHKYYEGCQHFYTKEAEGSCIIEKSRFSITNTQQEIKNVIIELDWS